MELIILLFLVVWLLGCFREDSNKFYALIPLGAMVALFYWFREDYLYVIYRVGPVFAYGFGYLLIFGVGMAVWNKTPIFIWRAGVIIIAILFIYLFGLPFVDGFDSSELWRSTSRYR
ncbi:hypothetical protein ACVS1I_002946 [Providencia rettgeri]|uniref:hypothetical protein n=1 Tax=Providencia sp. PROV274 TaxID=2949961 RepID=UPI00234B8B06|nr:hypothetical protein [Providencia sp. PROV274]